MAANPQVAATVELLTRLLRLLYPNRRNLDIVTVEDIQRRYPLTGLGVPAMRAIEQSQRIVRATNDYHLIGICEFHVGLIYLFWEDNRGASQQFAAARRQWSFVNATAPVCLALFAEGRAQELALHHESAMACYGKAEQRLPRIRFDPAREGLRRFTSTLAHELERAKETLRLLLQETWQDQENLPPGTVAPDSTHPLQTIAPVPQYPSPVSGGAGNRWYRAERQQDGFVPQILTGAFVQAETAVSPESPVSPYGPGDLVVVGLDDMVVSPHILLTPYQHDESFALLCLAKWVDADADGEQTLDVGDGPKVLAGTVIGRVKGHWVAV